MKNKLKSFNTTRYILLGFMIVILLGSLLLKLPISSATGESVPYIDALFTATSATCVTGLVTLPIFSTWSLFGKIVILCLIQIGGLGVITVMAGFMIFLNKKFGLKDYLLIQDTFNLNSMEGLKKFVRKVIFGTFLIEIIGALLYMLVFVPEFGLKGVWISIFNSISAFCNAGMDIISGNSLEAYVLNPIVNFVTCALIIIGGLGFIVWWDVIRIIKNKKGIKALTLHSKIVFVTTAILLAVGTLGVLAGEYNNPLTIKEYSLIQKLEVAFFQSVTLRTAGFATISQHNLTNATALLSLILMFIGASPAGTAGGIKTVTIAVLFVTMLSMIKNKNEITVFNRKLAHNDIRKAIAVIFMSLVIASTSTFLLSLVTDAPFIDIAFETVSATATVGLSRNLTSLLNVYGKLIIIATMYFGRVGPISLALALNTKKKNTNVIKHPVEEITIG
ncbi:MAG: potassium transporter KtrB [Clostridia bacterium]|nr:potassium transporter KtrB [Clostridia bacterium]